jgi:glucose/arabinose dehydrogenase
MGPTPRLPPPNKTLLPTVNIAPAQGWNEGTRPLPGNGVAVSAYATGLDHPRWLHVLPNGDVLVAETNAPPKPEDNKGIRGFFMKQAMKRAGAGTPSANRITLLRGLRDDGTAQLKTVFLENLNSPFGMALVGNDFYVANTDAVVRYAYTPGQTKIEGGGTKVVDLPAGPLNHHWTKSLIASPDGSKLYATVGSNSNVAEHGMAVEEGRAAIWEIDRATGKSRIFASGLRNPNGMTWTAGPGGAPVLWTVANERDEIGSDLVPDYLTSVRDGGFYGWPYSYFGQNVDERVKPSNPELVARAIAPDYALGPHTASLGLVSAEGSRLSPSLASGVFVGQHGSWNRRPAQRLQGDLRALRRRQAAGRCGRRADRLPQRGRQGERPAGRRGGRQDRRPARRRRCRQRDLAGDRERAEAGAALGRQAAHAARHLRTWSRAGGALKPSSSAPRLVGRGKRRQRRLAIVESELVARFRRCPRRRRTASSRRSDRRWPRSRLRRRDRGARPVPPLPCRRARPCARRRAGRACRRTTKSPR